MALRLEESEAPRYALLFTSNSFAALLIAACIQFYGTSHKWDANAYYLSSSVQSWTAAVLCTFTYFAVSRFWNTASKVQRALAYEHLQDNTADGYEGFELSTNTDPALEIEARAVDSVLVDDFEEDEEEDTRFRLE